MRGEYIDESVEEIRSQIISKVEVVGKALGDRYLSGSDYEWFVEIHKDYGFGSPPFSEGSDEFPKYELIRYYFKGFPEVKERSDWFCARSDELENVSIYLRGDQIDEIRSMRINLSAWVRDRVDEELMNNEED